ncbi:MAG: UDP-N-acetylmuramate dehydrogenase [Candidatus Moraniibacteriota bacterium]
MNFRSNVTLAPFTTFKIGGPAKLYAEVSDMSEVALGFERAAKNNLPVYVFSGGSNILFSDNGFSGLVMRITDGGFRILEGGRVSVGAGRKLDEIIQACCQVGLSGLERLTGIPGSVGGAVRGNAGAFGSAAGDTVISVKALSRKSGMMKEYRREECDFGYRMSFFKRHPELVIISVDFRLMTGGNPSSLMAESREIRAKRAAVHSQEAFCAGSFFMNPVVSDEGLREEFHRDSGKEPKDERLPAGWLIDQVGFRGKTIGNAKVSDQHPNYIVNTGGATAEEVLTLVSIVKQRVRDELGIQLQEEVQLVGFGHEEVKHKREKPEEWPIIAK